MNFNSLNIVDIPMLKQATMDRYGISAIQSIRQVDFSIAATVTVLGALTKYNNHSQLLNADVFLQGTVAEPPTAYSTPINLNGIRGVYYGHLKMWRDTLPTVAQSNTCKVLDLGWMKVATAGNAATTWPQMTESFQLEFQYSGFFTHVDLGLGAAAGSLCWLTFTGQAIKLW